MEKGPIKIKISLEKSHKNQIWLKKKKNRGRPEKNRPLSLTIICHNY
jgi:hypothetical protein